MGIGTRAGTNLAGNRRTALEGEISRLGDLSRLAKWQWSSMIQTPFYFANAARAHIVTSPIRLPDVRSWCQPYNQCNRIRRRHPALHRTDTIFDKSARQVKSDEAP